MLLRQLLEMNNKNKSIFVSVDGEPWHLYGVGSIEEFHDKLAKEVAATYAYYKQREPGLLKNTLKNSPPHLSNMTPPEMYQETLRYLSDRSRAHDNYFEIVGRAQQGAKEAWWSDLTSEILDDIIRDVTHEEY